MLLTLNVRSSVPFGAAVMTVALRMLPGEGEPCGMPPAVSHECSWPVEYTFVPSEYTP
jgi:hypothetical protein